MCLETVKRTSQLLLLLLSVPHLASQSSWMVHPQLQICLVEEATPLFTIQVHDQPCDQQTPITPCPQHATSIIRSVRMVTHWAS